MFSGASSTWFANRTKVLLQRHLRYTSMTHPCCKSGVQESFSSFAPCNFCSVPSNEKNQNGIDHSSTFLFQNMTSFRGPKWTSSLYLSQRRGWSRQSSPPYARISSLMILCRVWVLHFGEMSQRIICLWFGVFAHRASRKHRRKFFDV